MSTISKTFREDRQRDSDALLVLARNFDPIFDRLECDTTPDIAQDMLLYAAAAYSNPHLDFEDVREHFMALRDATNALTRWECDGVLDMSLEDVYSLSEHAANNVSEILSNDIDDALWPLLHGVSTLHACRECRRTGGVVDWQFSVTLMRCADHAFPVPAVVSA